MALLPTEQYIKGFMASLPLRHVIGLRALLPV